jgi:hypothetical protein
MPWSEPTLLSRVLAGIVAATLLAGLVFVFLAFNYFTLKSSTTLPLLSAGVAAVIGFVAGFAWRDNAVRAIGRLFVWFR